MLQMFRISWDQLLKGEKCNISVGPIQEKSEKQSSYGSLGRAGWGQTSCQEGMIPKSGLQQT